jgi:hypothetical protein
MEVGVMNAVAIFLFWLSASVIGLTALGASAIHLLRYRRERCCRFDQYYQWVMEKGDEHQKEIARRLARGRDLEKIQSLVGYGILVKS